MTAGALIGAATVPLFGALMCTAPAVTRPTLQFGVRIPPAHADAPVIRRERRAYIRRSAAIAICCTIAAFLLRDVGSPWLPRLILLVEVAANVVCFRLARRRIIAAKTAEKWFAGVRQTVVADTSWRTQPRRFPVRWLIPAIAVIAATIVIGVIRYPHLPAHFPSGPITLGARPVARSPFTAFTPVLSQLYVTGWWTVLLVLIYRSRPDIDAADPAGSLRGYRKVLDRFVRAALLMLALVDVTFLLVALAEWQFYRLSGAGGAAVAFAPAAAGVLLLIAVATRAGRERARAGSGSSGSTGSSGSSGGSVSGRDDDRFWKAGLLYVNRDDPAVVVSARIGVGWTLNFGNPAAWLVIGGIIATVGGLAVIRVAVGL
jgi:uncharacterized membrane protein